MGAPAHDFEYIAANDNPLVNLAHNFFFGDGVLFALGYKVCPTEINEPNNLGIRDSFAWRELGGKSDFLALNKPARVSLSGNCLTLTPNAECLVNAIQRSTAACQAFCSITDNGPCEGHGACVPADPASPSNFTCLCDAGVSPSNPSLPFHLPHYYTTSLASFPTPHLSQFSLSTALMLASPLPSCSPLHGPHARLCSALKLCPRIYTLSLSHLWSDFFMCAEKWEGLDVCEQFTLQQMLNATNNWSEDNVLGKGGFGVVYKGHSPQGQLWAIKRSTIMTNDFETEVRAMSSLHHMHLVRLLGFCLDQNVETGKQEADPGAMKLVEAYEVDELKDSKMPPVSEEAIVDIADLALDCIKSPGTRRPTMKDVAYRLSALIAKHCPDREDESENVVKEEGTSNQGMPSELCGDGGREPERSHGSQSGVISFTGTFSMTDSLKSWLQWKPSKGR
ncbi:unnamed protein product [Closterium sp. NIES-65]|nr:unnamed protein product [Closterium sp. NIES-65]